MLYKVFTVCLFFYTQTAGYVFLIPKEYIVPADYVSAGMVQNVIGNIGNVGNIGSVGVNTNDNYYYEINPRLSYNVIPQLEYQNWDRSDNLLQYDYKTSKVDSTEYARPKYHMIMEYPTNNDPAFMKDTSYEPYEINPYYDFNYREVQKKSPRKVRRAENKYVVSDKDILSSDYIITKRQGLTAVVTDTGYRIMHEISPGVIKEIRVDYENMVF